MLVQTIREALVDFHVFTVIIIFFNSLVHLFFSLECTYMLGQLLEGNVFR